MAKTKIFENGQPLSAADINNILTIPVPNFGDAVEPSRYFDPITPTQLGTGVTVQRILARRVGFIGIVICDFTVTGVQVPVDGVLTTAKTLFQLPDPYRFERGGKLIVTTKGPICAFGDHSVTGRIDLHSVTPSATATTVTTRTITGSFALIQITA